MRTALLGILVVPVLFLLSLFLLPKNTFALGATLNTPTQTCNATGTVDVTFSWTQQPNGAFFITDQQWLDLSTNAADPYGPGNFINHNVLGLSSYSTSTTPGNIGPLIPGTVHFWRINTHNQLEPDPAGWYPTASNFTTIACTGPPAGASTCTTSPTSIAPGGTITVSGQNFGNLSLPIGMVNGFGTGDTPLPNPTGGTDPFNVTETIPASTLTGTWRVYINAGGFGKVACTNLFDVTTAGGSGGGGGTCAAGATNVQDSIDTVNRCAIEANIFDDKIFNVNQITGTTDSLYMLLTGKSQLHPQTNGVTAGTGALAATGKLVTAMYSAPPVSGVQYFAHEFGRFNPVKEAYAQNGIGYEALKPVQQIWEALRNISYIGFIIVFVVIGFMIMFRSRISPQAVATVQDSLPRIVIALILVTFSYAIAGLMIDIMFLFLNIVISALKGAGVLNDNANVVFTKSVFGVVWGSWKNVFGAVADSLSKIITGVLDLPLGLDKFIGILGGAIGGIVVGIALLFIMFRVFFMLLIAYATIILLTMAAPFFFLFQALPGNNGAKEWFKQMAANVSIFPVTALMFIFAGILGNIASLGGTGTGVIGGAQVGQFPLLAGDISTDAIGKLIAVGFLLMTPSAADMVKKAIGAQGGVGGMGAGALAGAAAGAAVVGAGARRGFASAQENAPQQLGPQGSIAGKFKYVNPAWYRASSQVRQEQRTERIRHEAGTSLKDLQTRVKPSGGGGSGNKSGKEPY